MAAGSLNWGRAPQVSVRRALTFCGVIPRPGKIEPPADAHFRQHPAKLVHLMSKVAIFMGKLSIAMGDFRDPKGQSVEHFIQRLPVRASRPRQNMEGMIRTLDRFEHCTGAQTPNHWKQEFPFCQSVALALDEKHRNIDMRQVVGALRRGLFRRVQRKANKCEATDFWKRRGGLSLRCHASTERFPASNQCLARRELCGGLHGSEDRSLRKGRAIRAFRAGLHVRELIAKGGDLSRGKSVSDLEHERMVRPGPRAMGENITSGCSARRQIRRGHHVVGIDNDLERAAALRWH